MRYLYVILLTLPLNFPAKIYSQNVISCSSDFTLYSGNTGTENQYDSSTDPYLTCGSSSKNYEGADTIYQITATTSGFVYVVLSNMSANLDVLVYSENGGITCEALGRKHGLDDEFVCVKSDAGETYNILIDNPTDEMNVSFDLYVMCGYSISIHDVTCDADVLGSRIQDVDFQCNLKLDGTISSQHSCFQVEKYPECNSNSYFHHLDLKEDIYRISLPSYLPDLKIVIEADGAIFPFFVICNHYDRAIFLCNYEKKVTGYKIEYLFKYPATTFPDDEFFLILDGKDPVSYNVTIKSTKCSPPCSVKDTYCDDLLVSDKGDSDPHTFKFTALNKYSSQIIRWEIPGVYDDFDHQKEVSVTLSEGTHQICYVYKNGYDNCEYKCCKTVQVNGCHQTYDYCDDLLVSDKGDHDPKTFVLTALNKYSSQIIRWEIPGVYDDYKQQKQVYVTLPEGTHHICYVYKDGYDHCEYKCCTTIHVKGCQKTIPYCDDLLVYDKGDNDPKTFQFTALNKQSSQIIKWEIPGVYGDFANQKQISVTLPEGTHQICYVYKDGYDHCEYKCCKTVEVKGCYKTDTYCNDILVYDKGDNDPHSFQLYALNKYSSQIIRWEIPGTDEDYDHQNKISVYLPEGKHHVCFVYKDGYDHCEYKCCKTIEVKSCEKKYSYCNDILVYDKGDTDPGTFQFVALNKYSSQIVRWEIPGSYEDYSHQNKISVTLPPGNHEVCYVYKDSYGDCEYKCCTTVYVKNCIKTYADCDDIWVLDKGDDDPHTFQFIALNKTLSQILRWEIPGSANKYEHEFKVSATLPEGTHQICYVYKDHYDGCEIKCCSTITVAVEEDPCSAKGLTYMKNTDGTFDFIFPPVTNSSNCTYWYQITKESTLEVSTVQSNEGKDLKGYTFTGGPGSYQVCAYSVCQSESNGIEQSDLCCTEVLVEACETPQTGQPWYSNLGGYFFGTTVNLYNYTFIWDFYRGDTLFDTQSKRTPYLAYSSAPEYICLTTENICGTASYCADISCLNDNSLPYSFHYSFDEETGLVQFSFSQENLPSDLTYSWDFGDDSTAQTTDDFITHVYDTLGQYQVCCEISKPCDENSTDCCTIQLCRTIELDTSPVARTIPDFSIDDRINTKVRPVDLNVFPNPTAGDLTIQFESGESGSYTIELVNLYGQVLKYVEADQAQKSNTRTIQLSDLSPGTYFLNIKTDSERYSRKITLIN